VSDSRGRAGLSTAARNPAKNRRTVGDSPEGRLQEGMALVLEGSDPRGAIQGQSGAVVVKANQALWLCSSNGQQRGNRRIRDAKQ